MFSITPPKNIVYFMLLAKIQIGERGMLGLENFKNKRATLKHFFFFC